MAVKKLSRQARIKKSIRMKISGSSERPRLSVYRSNTAVYAQIIDDSNGSTLVASYSKETEVKGNNVEAANAVGKKIAEKAAAAGITKVVFDRNGYLYHGKIKAIADGAREGGLQF
ncbi:MAG: 50S ribosomal protein L18 [Bacteroidota bacterium]